MEITVSSHSSTRLALLERSLLRRYVRSIVGKEETRECDLAMDLEQQRNLIYLWFQGTFDNHKQCQYEKALEKRDGIEALHDWVFSKFFAADVPKIGTHVLLARQGFKESGQVYRQRLYAFHINVEEGCVENQIYKLNDESLFEKAEQDPSVVSDLDPSTDAECVDGCSVLWKYLPQENQFHGSTREGMCRFESRFFPGKTIIASSDIFIGPDHLWTRDRGVDTEGEKVYGFKSDEHHKFLRCTSYKGFVHVRKEGQIREVVVHNQGGEARIDDMKYSVKLAQSTELDTKANVLKLSVLRDGKDEVVGLALSDPDVDVIGGVFGDDIEIRIFKQK